MNKVSWCRRLLRSITVVLFLGGCATPPTKKGDVDFWESHGSGNLFIGFAMPGYSIRFPQLISLGSIGKTIIRVRDLPEPIFPERLYIDIPDAEADYYEHDQPWRSTLLKVQFRDTSGKVFFSRQLSFSGDLAFQQIGKSRTSMCLVFLRPAAERWTRPKIVSYDMIIEVMRPSKRRTDSIRIGSAFTYHNFSQ